MAKISTVACATVDPELSSAAIRVRSDSSGFASRRATIALAKMAKPTISDTASKIRSPSCVSTHLLSNPIQSSLPFTGCNSSHTWVVVEEDSSVSPNMAPRIGMPFFCNCSRTKASLGAMAVALRTPFGRAVRICRGPGARATTASNGAPCSNSFKVGDQTVATSCATVILRSP